MNGNNNDGGAVATTTEPNAHTDYADDEPVSTAVVLAIADVAGVDPAEIGTPLYDAIDPDALDNLFSDKHDGSPRMGGRVVFSIRDYEVTVHSYGEIIVEEHT